jgi:hypothetical protein
MDAKGGEKPKVRIHMGKKPLEKSSDEVPSVRIHMGKRVEEVLDIRTCEDLLLALTVGVSFESEDYNYEILKININGRGGVQAEKKTKTNEVVGKITFAAESLWEYFSEGRITL